LSFLDPYWQVCSLADSDSPTASGVKKTDI
jgi:hypothetical protein